jgi:Protein of unknown function (DUF1419)
VAPDPPENNTPSPEADDPGSAGAAPKPNTMDNPPISNMDEVAGRDSPLKPVKRPALRDFSQLRASELNDRQFLSAENPKALAGGSVAEQMRAIMDSSMSEQIRQAEQALRPFHRLQNTIGQLARDVMQNPLQQFFEEQESRQRQMMELLQPRWDQTLVGNAFADSLRSVQSFQSVFQSEIVRAQHAIHHGFDDLAKQIEALSPKLPSLTEISNFWLEFPARVKENLVALAEAGWYLDAETDTYDIVQFKEELENSTAEEINSNLAQYFRSSLDRIEASLCEDHPTRAHLIREAFSAHREGKYGLSIPALFAQADGICYDLTGYQIFARNGIHRFARRINPEALERAYLEPLIRAIPITESSQQRRARIPQLNRHAVMHGESTEFPTEENGLKAISFINFVSHVLGMAVSRQIEIAASLENEEPPENTH